MVASTSGTASIVIPVGALADEVPVAVEPYAPPFTDDNVLLPTAHMVAPSAVVLAVPATITLDYAADDLQGRPQRALRIERWEGSYWAPLSSNAILDSATRRLSASTMKFGLFAIRRDPCIPWDVGLSEPIVGVTSLTDCTLLEAPVVFPRFVDMYEFTLPEQAAFTLAAVGPAYASLRFSTPDAVGAPPIINWAENGWKEPALRAILSSGRYQLRADGLSNLRMGSQHTFTPAVVSEAQAIANVECDVGGVVLVAGVTINQSVTEDDCEFRLWPRLTVDTAAVDATTFAHPFFVALRGGDSATVAVTGSSANANVGLVVQLGVDTLYLDHPDSTSQRITLSSPTPARFRFSVRVHGRAANDYAFPGPTPYTLTITP